MTGTSAKPLTLRLERVLPHSREKVFEAWTVPTLMLQWWFDAAGYDAPIVEVDLRVGGAYWVAKTHRASGMQHSIRGVYQEIRRPEKLVFTWKWDNELLMKETTRVTVEFFAQGAKNAATRLVLTHEQLPTQELVEKHSQGWTQCLDRMSGTAKK